MEPECPKVTLSGMLYATARMFPEREAIVIGDQRVTYRQLKERSRRVASGLSELGVGSGDKVAIWMTNRLEWVYSFFAVSSIGGVLVPVNTRYKAEELRHVLEQSDSTTLIMLDKSGPVDHVQVLNGLLPELGKHPAGRIVSQKFPLLKRVICLGHRHYEGTIDFGSIYGSADDGRPGEVGIAIDPDDVALIQYTSGSTGFPKGVMLSHDNMARNAFYAARRLGLDQHDRYFGPLPFFHIAAAVGGILMAASVGACLLSTAYYEPELALQLIERERCTGMAGVETIYLKMLEHPNLKRYNLASLQKGIALGSEEFVRAIHDTLDIEHIATTYGLTEGSSAVTLADPSDPFEVRIRTAGKALPGIKVKVVDRETGEALPPGERGEICVRGWTVMKGYYKKPDETARAIDEEGWLHTGDLGILDEHGYLKFAGRVKDIIKVGGENVSAEEVENLLFTHPKVKLAQVIGVPDHRLSEVCMAFVELKPGESCTEDEIIRFCGDKAASFKAPRYVKFVSEWPLTGPGKIQKFKLKEMVAKHLAS